MVNTSIVEKYDTVPSSLSAKFGLERITFYQKHKKWCANLVSDRLEL